MLIVRHLGTLNLTSMDVTVCVIQYYTDQWDGVFRLSILKKDKHAFSFRVPSNDVLLVNMSSLFERIRGMVNALLWAGLNDASIVHITLHATF